MEQENATGVKLGVSSFFQVGFASCCSCLHPLPQQNTMLSLGLSTLGFLVVLVTLAGAITLVILFRDQIKALFASIGQSSFVCVVGVIAICFGTLDLVGTLAGLGSRDVYPSSYSMRLSSNKTYGGATARNDVDTDKSKYMYEFANVIEESGRAQLWQRLQLNIIILCAGAFLVAFGSQRE